ncbi:Sodium-coupled monocarboxylate transporter 2, partial [Armadillidium nasatum]
MSYLGNKSPEEFLMGNRSFKPLPVALSLLTSYVSAISILGLSGESYANGMQFFTITLGIVMALNFSTYLLLPILYPLKLTTVNEYIELRFKSKALCSVIFLLSTVKNLFSSGITLFAPTIALVSITKLGYLTNIFLLGIVCTLYSSLGGIKAVIWTDVFQISVMMIGLISVLTIGASLNGGIIETLYIASKGGRLELFDMNLSPFVRHTFINTVASGFFHYLSLYSSDQINFQRICTVKSIKMAQRVISYNVFGIVLIFSLIFPSGLVAYANYAGCDPMALGIIKRKEEIIPYFVMDKLSFIPGLPGIFVATLVGGSL